MKGQAGKAGKGSAKVPTVKRLSGAAKKAAASGTLRGNAGRKPAPKYKKLSNPDKKAR